MLRFLLTFLFFFRPSRSIKAHKKSPLCERLSRPWLTEGCSPESGIAHTWGCQPLECFTKTPRPKKIEGPKRRSCHSFVYPLVMQNRFLTVIPVPQDLEHEDQLPQLLHATDTSPAVYSIPTCTKSTIIDSCVMNISFTVSARSVEKCKNFLTSDPETKFRMLHIRNRHIYRETFLRIYQISVNAWQIGV